MKILFTIIIIFLISCAVLLFFYDIEFNTAIGDIVLNSRLSQGRGYSISYKNGFKFIDLTNLNPFIVSNGGTKNRVSLPFKKGEHLVYDIYLKSVKIGKSELTFFGEEDLGSRRCYRIGFTTNVPFFKDKEQIYAEKGNFLPIKVERELKNALGFTTKITEEYDQENFTVKIKKQGSSKVQTFEKSAPIYNAILLTYYCRANPDIAKDEIFKVILPTSEHNVQMSGKEAIETPSGAYTTTVYSSAPSKFTFYLSDDKKKIPVKISSQTALGYTLVLNSMES